MNLTDLKPEGIDVRPIVKLFAEQMEKQLAEKDEQYGPEGFLQASYGSLGVEAAKHLALATGDALIFQDWEGVRKHCTHAANFINFITVKALLDLQQATQAQPVAEPVPPDHNS